MGFLEFIISMLVIGLIVGGLARLALPGRDPMSIPMTIAIGIGGAFIGGLVGAAIGATLGMTWILGLASAALIVYFIRRSRGGGLTDPGVPPEY